MVEFRRVSGDEEQWMRTHKETRAILRSVKEFNLRTDEPIKSIVCPALGTGEGKMPVERCARQMVYAYLVVIFGQKEEKGGLAKAVENHMYLLD